MAKRVLIIDDEKDMRVYLTTLFQKAGYDVDSAENGFEGLVRAQSTKPDLITLDILMPKKSGLKAYRELRKTPETSDVPIIILTGLGRQEDFFGDDHEDVRRPDAIVEKPIDRDAFLKQAKAIMGD
jgi:CheY-like chemotaxis protein